MSLLEVTDLNIEYRSRGKSVLAGRDLNLTVEAGTLTAVVGESGSGKTTLGAAVAGALPGVAHITGGSVTLEGRQLIGLPSAELARSRYGGITLMPQNALNALNPVRTIEGHFRDVIGSHTRVKRKAIRTRASELLNKVGLDETVLGRYPHQLSGGMRQRVCLAMALSLEPRLIVFDEPTTALDVLTQQQVIETIMDLQRREQFAGLLISHDLGFALEHSKETLIMYAGRIVERLPSEKVLTHAQHPYTKALLACYGDPRADEVTLAGIPGSPPDLALGRESSCLFAPRCQVAVELCHARRPELLPVGEGEAACFVAQGAVEGATHA